VAKRKDTGGLKLVTEEAQSVEKQFRDLFARTNKKDPKPQDVEALRQLLRDNEGARLWERVSGPMAAAESITLDRMPGLTPGALECWRSRLAGIRRELRGEDETPVESMLAQHAALCWFRLAEVEILYSSNLAGQHTLTLGIYYEKRLTLAQRRFARAVETLERVRVMKRRAQAQGADKGRRRA
jgi:hypothetical protein